MVERKTCFVGDFNADLDRTDHLAGERFAGLRDHGWVIPRAAGDWSFKSGSRIDHAVAASSFPNITARYVSSYGDLIRAGSDGTAISERVALVMI